MYIRTLTPSDAEGYRALRLQSLQQHPEAFLSSYESEVKLSIETTRIRLDSSDEHFTLGAFLEGNRGWREWQPCSGRAGPRFSTKLMSMQYM